MAARRSGTEVTLPALGESVTEGTVSRWLKQVGDTVEADEPLLEVSTDKVDTEIPSPTAGTLLEIRVQEDETVEVGAVLAVVGEAAQPAAARRTPRPGTGARAGQRRHLEPEQTAAGDEGGQAPIPAPSAASAPSRPRSDAAARAATARPAPAKPAGHAGGQRLRRAATSRRWCASWPRSTASTCASVTGTGVGGRVRKQDVLAAAEEAKKAAESHRPPPHRRPLLPAAAASAPAAPAAEPARCAGTTEKMSRLRKTIAKRMVESLQVSAQLTATVEVDLTAISRIRARAKDDFKAREGASLSYLPFITKAAIEALKVYPKVNATIDTEAGEITYPDAEHIGIAVDTEKGLLVPVIKDAGDLNIAGLAKKIADLAARTRQQQGDAGRAQRRHLHDHQLRLRGHADGHPDHQPAAGRHPRHRRAGQAAGRDQGRQALGEVIAVRDMMYLSLSYDHRLVDGADAARFLSHAQGAARRGRLRLRVRALNPLSGLAEPVCQVLCAIRLAAASGVGDGRVNER